MSGEEMGVNCKNPYFYKIPVDELTRESVPSVKSDFLQGIGRDEYSKLTVDMSSVKIMDTAGVALLVQMKREIYNLELRNVSSGVKARIDVCQLHDMLLGNSNPRS